MKLRMGNMINKQLWFIVFVALTGGGLIYFLNSIGVIEAMRNDNTLDYLYEANVKLPKAPYKLTKAVTESYQSQLEDILQQEADQAEKISRIDSIVLDSSENSQNTNAKAKVQPSADSEQLHIPHIIHQTWDSYSVPATFAKRIKSWIQNHPDWEYRFWTTKAVHCFLEKYYPDQLLLYESYPDFTSKADAMRYFVLHHFGGFYVDLDTTSLKPLDVWADNFCCILSEEPYEHSYLVRGENSTSIVNSPMACHRGHGLFQKAISLLPEYAATYLGDYLHSTGPYFLQEVFKRFNQVQNRSRSVKFKTKCNITTVPPKYFLPRFDPSQSGIVDDKCYTYTDQPPLQRRLCEKRLKMDNKNIVQPESFMDHDWIHVSMLGYDWKSINNVPFFSIVPGAKNLENEFCGL